VSAAEATSEYAGASAAAIGRHYDLGNDFYRLWLDETLTYSCALWEEGDTLEQAQRRKLDYHVDQARAVGARRVLDVGCGWGSLLERLVDVHGVEQVVGLTLSEQQAKVAATRCGPRGEVRVESWVDHEPAEPYDAIISIGAFEHFARYGLDRDERIEAYRRFFRRCREQLVPGGRLSLQTNAKGSNVRLDQQAIRDLRFIIETIFTESELPWASEIVAASERSFELISVRNDAEHYARTCGEWFERLRGNRHAAVDVVGEQAVADYERYLSATVGHFEKRHLALLRLVFERV
jgi:cyclopropane-fatty-acyl-phospholipid synthase